MTILQIWLLTHYAAVNEPYALRHPEHANSEAVQEQREQLIGRGLLCAAPGTLSGYSTTRRGELLIADWKLAGRVALAAGGCLG